MRTDMYTTNKKLQKMTLILSPLVKLIITGFAIIGTIAIIRDEQKNKKQ